METKEKKSLYWFFLINTLLATTGMIYIFWGKPEGFLRHIIPAYFFGVISAYFTVFVLRKKMRTGKFKLHYLTLVIIIISLVIILYLIIH